MPNYHCIVLALFVSLFFFIRTIGALYLICFLYCISLGPWSLERMNIFAKRKTPQEQLRENNRALQRTMRELDREKQRLENEQVKIANDIRKMAKQNQMDTVKIMAKDLVRTRTYVTKLVKMRANIQAISLNMQTLKSTAQMSDSMKQVTRTLVQMNKQMKLPALQKTLREFEKESSKMEMKQDMISDAMDDVFEGEGDDEATDTVVQQVFSLSLLYPSSIILVFFCR